MGDSRSWAAEQEAEEYFHSPDRQVDQAYVDEWNRFLAAAMSRRAGDLIVSDLAFLIGLEGLGVATPTNRPEKLPKTLERLKKLASPELRRRRESRDT